MEMKERNKEKQKKFELDMMRAEVKKMQNQPQQPQGQTQGQTQGGEPQDSKNVDKKNHPIVPGDHLFAKHELKDFEKDDPKENERLRRSHNKHKADVRKLKRSIRKCVTDRRAVDQSIRKLNLKFLGHQFNIVNEQNTH